MGWQNIHDHLKFSLILELSKPWPSYGEELKMYKWNYCGRVAASAMPMPLGLIA
jgi:hypothetical protein